MKVVILLFTCAQVVSGQYGGNGGAPPSPSPPSSDGGGRRGTVGHETRWFGRLTITLVKVTRDLGGGKGA